MIERVQVFTPVYRLEPETVAAIFALQWSGALSWVFQRDNPYPDDGRLNILHQYQLGRKRFLAGDDEALLVIESDIIPPPDALLKLAALDADVAYGVYRFRQSAVINIFERYPGQPRNEGESLSLHPAKLRRAVAAGQVVCSGGGLGCALIKRPVLERFDFRLESGGYCDTYFNRDVMRARLTQMAEMSVVCGHKDEDGTIQWPKLPS